MKHGEAINLHDPGLDFPTTSPKSLHRHCLEAAFDERIIDFLLLCAKIRGLLVAKIRGHTRIDLIILPVIMVSCHMTIYCWHSLKEIHCLCLEAALTGA
jgi:hypothetical protein